MTWRTTKMRSRDGEENSRTSTSFGIENSHGRMKVKFCRYGKITRRNSTIRTITIRSGNSGRRRCRRRLKKIHYFKSESRKRNHRYEERESVWKNDRQVDLLKILGEDGLKTLTKMISTIYLTGQWPKYFLNITVIIVNKKQQAETLIP